MLVTDSVAKQALLCLSPVLPEVFGIWLHRLHMAQTCAASQHAEHHVECGESDVLHLL